MVRLTAESESFCKKLMDKVELTCAVMIAARA